MQSNLVEKCLFTALFLVGVLGAEREVLAAPPISPQLQAHLAAGEFGPALALARQAPPAAQNQMLAEIARAQAAAGAVNASLATATEINDDLLRSQAYQSASPFGAQGGGVQADFDTLIDLITSTIAPQTWEGVGGPGAIDGFPGGVYVDASGVLKKISLTRAESLAALRADSQRVGENKNVRQSSPLRKVSLVRLEREVQRLQALGQNPTEAMHALAGLQRIQYVLIYPESGDIVLAGKAGDWKLDPEGRRVSIETSRPVLALDDLVVTLRSAFTGDGRFGCSITPTQENLAKAKAYLQESAKTPLKPGKQAREQWLAGLKNSLGQQEIEVYGIDPHTRAAKVIVEADYRMKLVGMGLEEGVLGVSSYLDSLPDDNPPALDVLRWWFSLNYKAVHVTKSHQAFELIGQGVKVQSENELLTEQGKRVHTGESEVLNAEFAHSFTKHFPELCAKYPIYAELQNIFDLALVAGLLKSEGIPEQVGWNMTSFGPAAEGALRYEAAKGQTPELVDTVINHKLVGGRRIIAGVSGGVTVDPRKVIADGIVKTDDYGLLQSERASAAPENLHRDAWWWD